MSTGKKAINGTNGTKTLTCTTPTIHAEVAAINNAVRQFLLRGLTMRQIRQFMHKTVLYVVRVKNDILQSSAPCAQCLLVIKHWGIRNIIYSNTTVVSNAEGESLVPHLIKTKTSKYNTEYKTSGNRSIDRMSRT